MSDDAGLHAAAHAKVEAHDGELEQLRTGLAQAFERIDDVEAKADAAVMMHLEDDVDEKPAEDPPAEPERTEVEPRGEPANEEKKSEAPPAAVETGEKHTGMFL